MLMAVRVTDYGDGGVMDARLRCRYGTVCGGCPQ